jgi:Flp pilus assembly pilin Flp
VGPGARIRSGSVLYLGSRIGAGFETGHGTIIREENEIGDRVSILSLLRNTDESGQTMAEYAVVLGVITIAVVVTLGLLSTAISNLLNNVIASL